MIAKLLILHFIADFILQSREMGSKKSSELKWLLKHLGIQAGIFALGSYLLIPDAPCLGYLSFIALNTLIHGLIDWNIWRGYKLIVKHKLIQDFIKETNYNESIRKTKAFEVEVQKMLEARAGSFKYWEDHLFYTTIGFDQLLHGLTLVILADWLLK